MIMPPDGPPSNPIAANLLYDQRLPRNAVQRVYVQMSRLLIVGEKRTFGAEYVGELAGVAREHVGRHWDTLVATGYLVEHERGERNKRFFSLPVETQAAA